MCELLVRTELACMLSAGSTKEGFVVLVKFAHVDLQTLFSKLKPYLPHTEHTAFRGSLSCLNVSVTLCLTVDLIGKSVLLRLGVIILYLFDFGGPN